MAQVAQSGFVAYNNCYGGFSLSEGAMLLLRKEGFSEDGYLRPYKEYFGKGSWVTKDLKMSLEEYVDLNRRRTDLIGKIVDKKEYERLESDEVTNFEGVRFGMFNRHLVVGYDVIGGSSHGFEDHRSHPLLIKVIQTMGKYANGSCAKIKLRAVDIGDVFHIHEYDGKEAVMRGPEPSAY